MWSKLPGAFSVSSLAGAGLRVGTGRDAGGRGYERYPRDVPFASSGGGDGLQRPRRGGARRGFGGGPRGRDAGEQQTRARFASGWAARPGRCSWLLRAAGHAVSNPCQRRWGSLRRAGKPAGQRRRARRRARDRSQLRCKRMLWLGRTQPGAIMMTCSLGEGRRCCGTVKVVAVAYWLCEGAKRLGRTHTLTYFYTTLTHSPGPWSRQAQGRCRAAPCYAAAFAGPAPSN